jgi:hypothetical protein
MERNRDEVEQNLEETPQPGPEPTEPDSQDETPEKKKDEERVDPIMQNWESRSAGPDDGKIAQWKERYGEIYLMSFDPDDQYVWRPITRLEYKNIIQSAKDDPHYMEMVVQRCVLWPPIGVENLAGGKAGTIPTLHSVIMEGSNFLEPDQAVMLVRKL